MKRKLLSALVTISLMASSVLAVNAEPFRYEEEWNARTNSWDWGRSAIHWAYAEGVTVGKPGGKFDPDSPVTRAEAVKMIVSMKGFDLTEYNQDSAYFTDVNGEWYTPYVNAAFDHKIVFGKAEGIFDPNGLLTRAEAATMVVRSMDYQPSEESGAIFEDISDDWYTDYIKTAYDHKVVSGKSATIFDPDSQVTRAEMVMMLYNTVMGVNEKGMYCAIMIPDEARSFTMTKGEDVLLSYDELSKTVSGAIKTVGGEDWRMVYFTPTDSFELKPENGELTQMRIFANGRELAVGVSMASRVVVAADQSVTVYANTDGMSVVNGAITNIRVQENLKIETDNGDTATAREIWDQAVGNVLDLTGQGFEAYRTMTGTYFGTYPIYHPFSTFYKFSPTDDSLSMEIEVDYGATKLVHALE